MQNVIIASDSYKGSLTSSEVNKAIAVAIREFFPLCNTTELSISDGGEGFLDSFSSNKSWQQQDIITYDALMRECQASYLYCKGKAIIELAQAAGLILLKENERNPMITTTFGVGIIIADAIKRHKCKEIIIGLGGSATNDGALGAMQALGLRLYDANNQLIPFGISAKDIPNIYRYDASEMLKLCQNINITLACDVDNPMVGNNGAAHVFAPQKGANVEQVELLEKNMNILSEQWIKLLGKNVSTIHGGGAAGAFSAGFLAFLDVQIKRGIDIVLDVVDFDRLLQTTDLVVTGEGRVDGQSFGGKVLSGIYNRVKKSNCSMLVVGGSVELKDKEHLQGVDIISTKPDEMPLSQAMTKEIAVANIKNAMREYLISRA